MPTGLGPLGPAISKHTVSDKEAANKIACMRKSALLYMKSQGPDKAREDKQQKTGRELLIPLHRDIVEALDAYDMQHIVIITTAYGKSFTVDENERKLRAEGMRLALPMRIEPLFQP